MNTCHFFNSLMNIKCFFLVISRKSHLVKSLGLSKKASLIRHPSVDVSHPRHKERNLKRHDALHKLEEDYVATALAPKVEGRIVKLDTKVRCYGTRSKG